MLGWKGIWKGEGRFCKFGGVVLCSNVLLFVWNFFVGFGVLGFGFIWSLGSR